MTCKETLTPLLKRFIAIFPSWFWSVLALCLLQRLIAIVHYFRTTFWDVYQPKDIYEIIRIWVNALGESTLLGISYDILFAALLAVFLVLLPRVPRFVVLFILALFLASNINHIAFNHSHITLATMYLGADTTFIQAMLTRELVMDAAFLLVMGLFVLTVARWQLLNRVMGLVSIVVIILAIFAPVQGSFAHPTWLQSSPLLGSPLAGEQDVDERAFSQLAFERRRAVSNDVDPEYNVLVVYMEGLSRHSLRMGDMTTMSNLAGQNIEFTRFISPQLVTANGLFASLTGNLPYFVSGRLKWVGAVEGSEALRDTLPSLLRDTGYQTAFLQSANLEYMSKDEIMPRLGFDVVLGRKTWDTFNSEDRWGIDDRAFFGHALEYLDTLDPERPWFVSMLTTGTHAPYNVPADYLTGESSDRFRALRYLDDAVKVLIDGLQERGLLENTIVVLTSDESRERSVDGQLQNELALNWLPLIVMHPSRHVAQFENYMSATQFPQLVMDMLKDDFLGDLAAAPESAVALVFGNIYTQRFYWYEPRGDVLLVCITSNFVCAQYDEMDDPMTAIDREPDRVAHYPFLEQSIFVGEPAE